MTARPNTAMVLAAGLGTRMRPLTRDLPKPLIEVRGRTLLDRALDRLAAAGVESVVVNTHHLADRIAAHLADRRSPRTIVSHEPALLETGGGVKQALPFLGDEPFYVVNADAVWTDGPVGALHRLAAAWDDQAMDALLLLHPRETARGYDGRGDYFVEADMATRRRRGDEVAPYVFAGVQILHPRLFDGAPHGRFSLTRVYDRAESGGRLATIVHDGGWFHVGTPEGLGQASAALAEIARSGTPIGTTAPTVYSIAPGLPFLDALAAGILARAGPDPAALADHVVLLPTRRSCRALADAFLRQSGGRPLLLPRLTPLGDLDPDELALAGGEEAAVDGALDCVGARASRTARRYRIRRRDWPASWPGCSTRCRPSGWRSTPCSAWCPTRMHGTGRSRCSS
jgi:MurNAc alpha-1-phosphate uridylyltransferase